MRTTNGAFLISRSLYDSGIWYKPAEWLKIWMYLLGNVNWQDNNLFKRGENFFKYEVIAVSCGVSINTINKCIKYLITAEQIQSRKTSRGAIISINNFDKYQDFGNYGRTEAEQKQNRSRTSTITITEEGNKGKKEINREREKKIETASPSPIDSEKKPETPEKTPPAPRTVFDYYEKELERVEDPEVRDSVATWWEYKKGYKSYKTPVGWKSFISIVLGYEKSVIVEAITRAMAGSWQGIRPQDVKKERERWSIPGRVTRSDYFWLLDEWPEAIQVIARNELNDIAFATKRQVDENTARGKIHAVAVRYYRQPGKATEDEATAIAEIIREWRERNQKTDVEETPNKIIADAIKKIILKK